MMENWGNPDVHFFAISDKTWAATTAKRDLRDLLALMNEDNRTYLLWMIPTRFGAVAYEVKGFIPEVDGAVYCGKFVPRKKVK